MEGLPDSSRRVSPCILGDPLSHAAGMVETRVLLLRSKRKREVRYCHWTGSVLDNWFLLRSITVRDVRALQAEGRAP